MRFRSLRSRLLVGVGALVVGSSLMVALLAIYHYSCALRESTVAEAENRAHSIALEATNNILVNDLVTLQLSLDHHMRSNPSLAYLMILRENDILAHTFDRGVPLDLISANKPAGGGNASRSRRIVSQNGDRYIDIAWPIFGGRAGILRLGLSEASYMGRVTELWLEVGALTLVIFLLVSVVSYLFIERITVPLSALAAAVETVDETNMEASISLKSHDEVGKLATSFSKMMGRLRDYTRNLEEKSTELDKANREMQTFCHIVQQIGGQQSLDGVGSFLIKALQGVIGDHEMLLYIFSSDRELLFLLSDRGTLVIHDNELRKHALGILQSLDGIAISPKEAFRPPLLPEFFPVGHRQTLIPLRAQQQIDGVLVISCPSDCPCEEKELHLVDVILEQVAGNLVRAITHAEEIQDLKNRRAEVTEFKGIVGKDTKMQEVYRLIEDVAPTDATVLIQGESGTGKELVAQAIHRHSPREDRPFVVINCSAYPASLLESELFGHEKGAFTGAIRQRIGRFEEAHTGTVFLDEIGEVSPSAQIKLLRVLQTHRFKRIGGDKVLSVDVRILAATNKDLLQQVKTGSFREDLYYRLNVIPIYMPTLHDRRNDIPILARHFLRLFGAEQGKDIEDFSTEAMKRLLEYSWPGNVRELGNTIEHVVVLAKGSRVEVTDLPSSLLGEPSADRGIGLAGTIQENEKRLLMTALEECNWNKKQAAVQLGISRSSLYSKLNKYQITSPTIH